MPPRSSIAIRRVSQSNGREGDSFSSPQDQRDKIEKFAKTQGWQVAYPEPEINVSGDALLENRPQLSRAVMAVQAGTAQVIVASDTSRLWWNHETAALVSGSSKTPAAKSGPSTRDVSPTSRPPTN